MGEYFLTPGVFSWHELMTTDPSDARTFYAELLGWDYSAMELQQGGVYHSAVLDGKDLAGIMLKPDMVPAEIPPFWSAYVTVENAEATAGKASELGGQLVFGPMDIPKVGRIATIVDRQGAALNLYQPESAECVTSLPEGAGMKEHFMKQGVFSWNELMVPDVEDARGFYGELFGWQFEESPMEHGGAYHVVKVGEHMIAGMFTRPPFVPEEIPNFWSAYITVNDVDASAKKVEELGGAIVFPLTDIPNVGRFCAIQDRQGAAVNLITYANKG